MRGDEIRRHLTIPDHTADTLISSRLISWVVSSHLTSSAVFTVLSPLRVVSSHVIDDAVYDTVQRRLVSSPLRVISFAVCAITVSSDTTGTTGTR